MKYTIEDLREGRCAVKNDYTPKSIKKVLGLAFPLCRTLIPVNMPRYFYMDKTRTDYWEYSVTNRNNLPTQSVKDFLKSGGVYKNGKYHQIISYNYHLDEPEITKEYLTQNNTVFHCETKEEANELLKIADSFGLIWCDGISYLSKNYFSSYDEICYSFNDGEYGSLSYWTEEGYTIIKASTILNSNKKGDEEDSKRTDESDRKGVRPSYSREESRRLQSGFNKSYRRQGKGIEGSQGRRRF